jgi:Ohr subfamily peroxiredoxin
VFVGEGEELASGGRSNLAHRLEQALRRSTTALRISSDSRLRGGREGGVSQTSDGGLNVKLTTPGAKGEGTNPEQLSAFGWSSCFLSAIKIDAAAMKTRLPADTAVNAEVDAEVDLGTTGDEYLVQARLSVSLPGVDRKTAQKLVEGAHKRCPYSKATHGDINIVTTVIDRPAAVSVR